MAGDSVGARLCWGLFLVSTVWFALQKETQNAISSFLLWKSL